jgi:hypothetical protein
MESWEPLRNQGLALACFDESLARRFVAEKLELRHLDAFDACYHPAMRSDYFRLCYIGVCGGCELPSRLVVPAPAEPDIHLLPQAVMAIAED